MDDKPINNKSLAKKNEDKDRETDLVLQIVSTVVKYVKIISSYSVWPMISLFTMTAVIFGMLNYTDLRLAIVENFLESEYPELVYKSQKLCYRSGQFIVALEDLSYKQIKLERIEAEIGVLASLKAGRLQFEKFLIKNPTIKIISQETGFKLINNMKNISDDFSIIKKQDGNLLDKSILVMLLLDSKIEILDAKINLYNESGKIFSADNFILKKKDNKSNVLVKFKIFDQIKEAKCTIECVGKEVSIKTNFEQFPCEYISDLLKPQCVLKSGLMDCEINTKISGNGSVKHDFKIEGTNIDGLVHNIAEKFNKIKLSGNYESGIVFCEEVQLIKNHSKLNIKNLIFSGSDVFVKGEMKGENISDNLLQSLYTISKIQIPLFQGLDIKSFTMKINYLYSGEIKELDIDEARVNFENATVYLNSEHQLSNLNGEVQFKKNGNLLVKISNGLLNKVSVIGNGIIEGHENHWVLKIRSTFPINLIKNNIDIPDVVDISSIEGYLQGYAEIKINKKLRELAEINFDGNLFLSNLAYAEGNLSSNDNTPLVLKINDGNISLKGTVQDYETANLISLDYTKNSEGVTILMDGAMKSEIINRLVGTDLFSGEISILKSKFIKKINGDIGFNVESDLKNTAIVLGDFLEIKNRGLNGVGELTYLGRNSSEGNNTGSAIFSINTEFKSYSGKIVLHNKQINEFILQSEGVKGFTIKSYVNKNNEQHVEISGEEIELKTLKIPSLREKLNLLFNINNVLIKDINIGPANLVGSVSMDGNFVRFSDLRIIFNDNTVAKIKAVADGNNSQVMLNSSNPQKVLRILGVANDLQYGDLSINYLHRKTTGRRNGSFNLNNTTLQNEEMLIKLVALMSVKKSRFDNCIGFNKITGRFELGTKELSLSNVQCISPLFKTHLYGSMELDNKKLNLEGVLYSRIGSKGPRFKVRYKLNGNLSKPMLYTEPIEEINGKEEARIFNSR